MKTLPTTQKIRKKAYCHRVNNFISDLTFLLLKISTTFNNGMGNLDMYLFIEENIRGGISMITQRLSTVNNKYMNGDKYKNDPLQEI